MLENATRICGANFGNLLLFDGKGFYPTATKNAWRPTASSTRRSPLVPGPHTGLGSSSEQNRAVLIEDSIKRGRAYSERDPLRMATANVLKARTFLAVPMMKF